ncbi:hypothetical protein ACSBR2_002730 [Camellia fascicularis]
MRLAFRLGGCAPFKTLTVGLLLIQRQTSAVVQAVRDKFEIGDNYKENSLSQKVVENKCYVLYKDWKCRMKKKLEKLVDAVIDSYAHPYKGVQSDDWKYLIDQVWLDPKNKMDDLMHKAKLYRTNWHYKHFWKEYIFLDRCVWKRFGRSSSYIFWMNVYGKYLDRLLACIFFDCCAWITV